MGMPMPRPPSPQLPPNPPADTELQALKARIAQVWAVREALKRALNQGATPPSQGLRELETVDQALAELDTRFKRLWDLQQITHNAPPKEPA